MHPSQRRPGLEKKGMRARKKAGKKRLKMATSMEVREGSVTEMLERRRKTKRVWPKSLLKRNFYRQN